VPASEAEASLEEFGDVRFDDLVIASLAMIQSPDD
jgi:hypothetical protein